MKALLLCIAGAVLVPIMLGYLLVSILYAAAILTRYKPR